LLRNAEGMHQQVGARVRSPSGPPAGNAPQRNRPLYLRAVFCILLCKEKTFGIKTDTHIEVLPRSTSKCFGALYFIQLLR
jgi:hypothetical protein